MGKALTSAIAVARGSTARRTIRAVDYLRVSTEEQKKGYGIQAAGKKTTRHIERKGWDHVGTYADEGFSGSLEAKDRPDLKRLMADVRKDPRPFDMVVVSEGRAIGRTGRAFWRWVWDLEDLGVYVAVVRNDYDNSTQTGRSRMRDDAAKAEDERESIRDRTQGGIQEKAEEGGHFGGVAPFGYWIADKGKLGLSRLLVCETALITLWKAWDLLVKDRLNCRQAAAALNALDMLAPRGGLWSGDGLRQVLKSTVIQKGVRVYRNTETSGARSTQRDAEDNPIYGATVEIELDRIFTPEQVLQLNVALARGARGPRELNSAHPLTKRVTGLCGKHYTGSDRKQQENRIYRCSGKSEKFPGDKRCDCAQIGAGALEQRVWTEVCALLADPGRLSAMAEDWVGLSKSSGADHAARVEDLERQIAGLDTAITATTVAVAKEMGSSSAIRAATAQLKEERAALEGLLTEAKSWRDESLAAGQRARDLQSLADMARERLHDMQAQEQTEVLELLDIRVTILGPVPPRTRRDDQVVAWFRSRKRPVPFLTDSEWALVESLPLAGPRPRKQGKGPRLMLEAILHKARTACSWRELPEQYGPWETVVGTWRRWTSSGLWDQIMEHFADVPGVLLPKDRVTLPPLRVEGKVDPRLLIHTQEALQTGLANRHIVGLTYVL
ncbi:recombinase family protein [Streptomyces sp. NPDC002018]|uniref:recombinase family protein n=1 Tax=Streptomyces sp. NPDC002018 TaxID=3364629 RepID=UPI003699AA95